MTEDALNRGRAAACITVLAAGLSVGGEPGRDLVLRYSAPAQDWEREALPVGNGRLGAMVFGAVDQETIQFNEDSLWTGDENASGKYDTMGSFQNFGALGIELETAKLPVVSCPSGQKPVDADREKIANSVDGDPGTKWCIVHGGRPLVWQVALPAGKAVAVTSYSFTAAEDVPARDPREWALAASNDGKNWVELDHPRDQPQFDRRHQKRTWSVVNETPYRYYRVTFLGNHGATHYQLAEIELGGIRFGADRGMEKVTNYRRELDLSRAVCTVAYERGGTHYRREVFCSYPDQVLVVKLTADGLGKCRGRVVLTDAHGAAATTVVDRLTTADSLANGLRYEAQVMAINDGGRLRARDGSLEFADCDGLVLLLAAGTDYLADAAKGWRGEDPHQRVTQRLRAAAAKPYAALLRDHVADYRGLFDRVAMDLGGTPASRRKLPTDQRLAAYAKDGDDRGLEALYFQFGRYLLISCSRPGSLPANLQGVWNHRNNAPWHSDYHSNINLQMNYWPAETTNLSECHEALIDMLDSMRGPWRAASRAAFGEVGGWTVRTSHNIFGGQGWKWNLPGGAWYGQHVWEHYAFGRDRAYLQDVALPILKELCEFWQHRLKALPDGALVAPGGWSPEHGPVEDGVTYDQEIIWDLFTNFIAAASAVGSDDPYVATVAELRDRLLRPKIGRWGQLQEWMIDRDDPKDHHRHVSHMFALFPGHQISPLVTPDLAAAARVSLTARGAGSDVGWSNAWKTALWARLLDADQAYGHLNRLIARNAFPNLFNACWPGRVFQIDGNLGGTAALAEMLLQSHAGVVHLLPALPAAWSTGSVKGLCARGGFVVDVAWQERTVIEARIRSSIGGRCRVRTDLPLQVRLDGQPVGTASADGAVLEFDTEPGREYSLQPR